MMGRGFKIHDDGLGKTDPNSVSVVLNYLYEVTADGETIGASLVDLETQEYRVKQTVGMFFNDIKARRLQFEAMIDGVGKIGLDAYIMLSDGNITTPGDEVWVVSKGDVKFNVDVSDWSFCGDETPCGDANQTSVYLDLAISIQGSSEKPEQSEDNSLLFSLGGNVPLLLSSQIEVDDFMQDMPEGFPRVESTDNQGTVFYFRFPRFEDTVKYDPIVPYHYAISVLTDEVDSTVPEVTVIPTKVPVVPTTSPAKTTQVPVSQAARNEDEESDKPSGGSIAGIIIGSLLGLCCCCFGFGYARKKREANGYSAANADEKNNVTVDEAGFDDEEIGRRVDNDEEEGGGGETDSDQEDEEDDEGDIDEDEDEESSSGEESEDSEQSK